MPELPETNAARATRPKSKQRNINVLPPCQKDKNGEETACVAGGRQQEAFPRRLLTYLFFLPVGCPLLGEKRKK